MKDIENRKDVIFLIDTFYKKIIADDTIGFFFTEVIVITWAKHMPVMYDFWESTLLGQAKYKGNPMLKHLDLNIKEPLKPAHFERWLHLWEETIGENFAGKIAEEAIKKANQIGGLMKFKIEQQNSNS